MIRIQTDQVTVDNMNAKLEDDSKPHEGVIQIRNLMDAIAGRVISGTVAVAVRETTESISADGDGDTATYSLV